MLLVLMWCYWLWCYWFWCYWCWFLVLNPTHVHWCFSFFLLFFLFACLSFCFAFLSFLLFVCFLCSINDLALQLDMSVVSRSQSMSEIVVWDRRSWIGRSREAKQKEWASSLSSIDSNSWIVDCFPFRFVVVVVVAVLVVLIRALHGLPLQCMVCLFVCLFCGTQVFALNIMRSINLLGFFYLFRCAFDLELSRGHICCCWCWCWCWCCWSSYCNHTTAPPPLSISIPLFRLFTFRSATSHPFSLSLSLSFSQSLHIFLFYFSISLSFSLSLALISLVLSHLSFCLTQFVKRLSIVSLLLLQRLNDWKKKITCQFVISPSNVWRKTYFGAESNRIESQYLISNHEILLRIEFYFHWESIWIIRNEKHATSAFLALLSPMLKPIINIFRLIPDSNCDSRWFIEIL